jgi:hypothetical protein
MALSEYLEETRALPSETAFYSPLREHILRGLLGYPAKSVLIAKPGEAGTPDLRLLSGDDGSEWIVGEAKVEDAEIRIPARRERLWREQVVARGYLGPETVHVLLCAPRTFYVCELDGSVATGVEIDGDTMWVLPARETVELKPAAFREALDRISYAESERRPQYARFREGEFPSGHLPLTEDTIPKLRQVFNYALSGLKEYCLDAFHALQTEIPAVRQELRDLDERLEIAGSDFRSRAPILSRRSRLRRRHKPALELLDEDYPQFVRDQAYAGTDPRRPEDFEDIFATNTAHVALSRLFFVRICEDVGLTTRKLSNCGVAVWRQFVDNIKDDYADLLWVAFRDVAHVYPSLFEPGLFDWFGRQDRRLGRLLEGILFRLNAFSFAKVDRDVLGTIYQQFRPKTERKRLGEYYTDETVVDYLLARTGIATDPDLMQKRILDPACGSFTFGVRALPHLLRAGANLRPANQLELIGRCLVGWDINAFSAFLSHLSLLFATLDLYLQAKREDPKFQMKGYTVELRNSLMPHEQQQTLTQAASLFDEPRTQPPFEYVVGNPPFVRNERLPEEDRRALEQLFAEVRYRNTDLSTFFLDEGVKVWLKDGGTLGMVAPIGLANATMAERLRQRLSQWSLTEVVSLEWMAKELFPEADIIPMLVMLRKEKPAPDHRVTIVSGLRDKGELRRAADSPRFRARHASEIPYGDWLALSPTGDWPLEVKARDVPILRKLRQSPTLDGLLARAACAVKLSGAKIIRPREGAPGQPGEAQFVTGQDLCAFHCSEADEWVDLQRLNEATDLSVWRDLRFYERNRGKRDDTGLGCAELNGSGLFEDGGPSDTLVCALPSVYTTLVAACIDPLQVCANDSAFVAVPARFSAHVLCALLNSRVMRHYAFLLMRAAILLRRRATWYPRTIRNLPAPNLSDSDACSLHRLAVEAAELSASVTLNELDLFAKEMAAVGEVTKAGFLGVASSPSHALMSADDVAGAVPAAGALRVGEVVLSAPADSLLRLVRLAMLATGREEFPAAEVEDLLLPSDPAVAARIANRVANVSAQLQSAQERMSALTEEIDEIVAKALGLTAREHETIRRRCQEFPLSVTVERPRYVWSADRKVQARRVYAQGERFRPGK